MKNSSVLESKVEALIQTIQDIYPSRRELMFRSLIQGICFGLGTTLGASLIIGVLTYVATKLQLLTVLQYWSSQF